MLSAICSHLALARVRGGLGEHGSSHPGRVSSVTPQLLGSEHLLGCWSLALPGPCTGDSLRPCVPAARWPQASPRTLETERIQGGKAQLCSPRKVLGAVLSGLAEGRRAPGCPVPERGHSPGVLEAGVRGCQHLTALRTELSAGTTTPLPRCAPEAVADGTRSSLFLPFQDWPGDSSNCPGQGPLSLLLIPPERGHCSSEGHNQ